MKEKGKKEKSRTEKVGKGQRRAKLRNKLLLSIMPAVIVMVIVLVVFSPRSYPEAG